MSKPFKKGDHIKSIAYGFEGIVVGYNAYMEDGEKKHQVWCHPLHDDTVKWCYGETELFMKLLKQIK